MKGYSQGITPQQKMVAVNNKFGNTNIKSQQGTTRVLYDTVEITGQTEFRFFENASSKSFPLTNLTSDGNKLGVGETFTIERIYFDLVRFNANNEVIDFQNSFLSPGPPVFQCFEAGELDFYIANSQVIKGLVGNVFTLANPTKQNERDTSFKTASDIVIPPLLEFLAVLKSTTYTLPFSPAYTHIRLNIQGTAGILAPRSTF
jgi:hypothetical protein